MEKLVEVVRSLEKMSARYIVAGRMSNVLFKNGAYNGVIIKTSKIDRNKAAENEITLSCGSGFAKIIRQMACNDLGGMEGLAGIPGTVGGMVKQNAGAFGYEVSDRFKKAVCYDPERDEICNFSKSDMKFGYRDSILKKSKLILLNATFEMTSESFQTVIDRIDNFAMLRKKTQPVEYPSLGSVFERYDGVSAGYYIDKAGLKGTRIGGACISEKHAGFIVNEWGATSDDYLRLINLIKCKVYTLFGIELKEEIEII